LNFCSSESIAKVVDPEVIVYRGRYLQVVLGGYESLGMVGSQLVIRLSEVGKIGAHNLL